jgi:hypothetical protein
VLTLDSVNFGSGYFPHLKKPGGMSGYFAIASALKRRFEQSGPFSVDELQRITAEDCRILFGQENDDSAIAELMRLFSRALNDLGIFMRHYQGNYSNVVVEAAESAEALVQILSRMPFFRDVSVYDDITVPFYKRAQLTAADLILRFGRNGYGRFVDADSLTIFADNAVPNVLRVDGILEYTPSLITRIAQGTEILHDSVEEIEIRACALHAVELLIGQLTALGHRVTARELDYVLWTRGQKPQYKAVPRHRTRCVYY